MALTAAELHGAARKALDGPLAGLGFRRVPKASTASWIRPEGERWLFLWFQPHRWNGAHSAGFRFTVELRVAIRPVLYAAGPAARLPELLSVADRETLRQMENRTLARVPLPGRAYLRTLTESMRPTMLADWKPRFQPYRSDEDVWFRLADRSDLVAVLAFIVRVVPGAIDGFAARRADPPPGAALEPGTPAWDRLVVEFHAGPGASIWARSRIGGISGCRGQSACPLARGVRGVARRPGPGACPSLHGRAPKGARPGRRLMMRGSRFADRWRTDCFRLQKRPAFS